MDLIASILKLHATGIERMLRIAGESAGNPEAVLGAFQRDPLVRALLLLHGLNDQPPELRVQKALHDLEPQLKKLGAIAEVLKLEAGSVSVRIGLTGHSCGSTAESVRLLVERAIIEAAPDMGAVEVRIEAPSGGFVPISAIGPAANPQEDAARLTIK